MWVRLGAAGKTPKVVSGLQAETRVAGKTRGEEMTVRTAMNKKPVVRKMKKLRKKSSSEVTAIALDYRREAWGGGKPLGRTRRQRKPAAMEMNRRYRAGKQDISHFHPEHYSTGELEVIAAGRGCEAWSFVMRRNDIPKRARTMAMIELANRDARRRK